APSSSAPASSAPASSAPAGSAPAAPGGSAAGGAATVQVAKTSLGNVLTDDKGRTLYMFTVDKGSTSLCYNECEAAWPPLLTTGKAQVGKGLDARLVGTTTRKDGTKQVTYKGLPLYYFTPDKAVGDTTGQGVKKVWYVV